MGNSPDVRVRLTAEGQKEIIDAFRKIQQEAEKAGRVGKRGLDAMSTAASTLGRLLPGLTFAGAIAGATLFAKRSLEAGENLAKLSQRFGISVENLSAWSHAAEISETNIEELAKGLSRLARNMQAAAQGGEEQLRAFKRVGITQRELQNGTLTLDEAILRISKHIAAQPDDWQKAAQAQILFGKSGANLIPFFNQGPEGLKRLREEAERLGLVWSTEAAVAADQFNDNMRRLRGTIEGFVNRELAALLPLLVDITNALLDNSAAAEKAGITWGQRFAAGVLSGGAAVRAVGGFLKDFTTKGGFAGMVTGSLSFSKNLQDELDLVSRILFEALDNQGRTAAGSGGKAPPLTDDTARTRALNAAKQLAEATVALQRTTLENELAITRAHNSAMTAEDAARFKEGLTAIEAYFAGRRRVLEEEGKKEVEALEEQARILAKRVEDIRARPLQKTETPLTREAEALRVIAELDKVATEAEVRRIRIQTDSATLAVEEREAVRKSNEEALKAEAELAQAQGRRFDAARLELDAQIAGLKRLAGESEEAFNERRAGLFDAGEASIQFEELEARAAQIFADIQSGRRAIDALVRRGVLSELEGLEQVSILEKERLPQIEAIAAEMANAGATPEQIARVRELNDATVELAASADLAGRRVAEFRVALEGAIASDITNFFARGIDDATSFGDAMRSLALSVVQSLRQIVSQMIATLIVTRLLRGVIGAIAGVGGAATQSAAGGFASGGMVHGAGSGTSDSIPAWLSAGEYVIPARIVSQPGMLEVLEDLRRGAPFINAQLRSIGRVRGYADGGLVDGTPGGGALAGLKAEIDLNDALVAKRITVTPEFQRAVLRVVSDNPRALRKLIGA